MDEIKWPPWQEILHAIQVSRDTGIWPDAKIPLWAAQVSLKFRCHAGSFIVERLALEEVIRQLVEKVEARPES